MSESGGSEPSSTHQHIHSRYVHIKFKIARISYKTISTNEPAYLSRHQTIDKGGQLFGRGLVSEDNRLMKSFNHDTCHLSRHDCDVKKMADDKDADAFILLYFLTAKQHKKRTIWVRRWLLDR